MIESASYSTKEERSRVRWDAAGGSSGGDERRACEAQMKMGKYSYNVGELDQGAVTSVVDLAKAFEQVHITVVWCWSNVFRFFAAIFKSCLRVLSAPAKGDL